LAVEAQRKLMATVFTVAMALLIQEIMLSAIFNVLLGPLHAVVAISLALLGLAGGGLLVMSYPETINTDPAPPALLAGAVFVLLAVASPLTLMSLSGGPELVLILVAVSPFIAGGVCLSLLLRHQSERSGLLYACDLGGAALGCWLSVVLLTPLGAPKTMLLAALPAALVLAWRALGTSGWRQALVLLPGLFLLVEAILSLGFPLLEIKRLSSSGRLHQPRHSSFPAQAQEALEFQEWGSDAWTIVRKSSTTQQWEGFRGWGLSPQYKGPVPELKMINYNLRFTSYVTRFNGDIEPLREWLDADLVSLHYQLGRHFNTVLNVGAGGGREVLNALNHGAKKIVALDLSEATIERLMKGQLSAFSGGLYLRPEVTALAEEGRSYLARHPQLYDLLDFTIVGGSNFPKMELLEVDPLFTREAFDLYLSRLHPEGVFSYVMYSQRSAAVLAAQAAEGAYLPALQTLLGLRQAMEQRQPELDFSRHVLVAGLPGVIDPDYDLVHIIASPTAFSAPEVELFKKVCLRLGFGCWHPKPVDEPENLYSMAAGEGQLPMALLASTDDRPFQLTEGPSLWSALRASRLGDATLALGVLALLLLLAPLAQRRELPRKRATLRLITCVTLSACAYAVVQVGVLLKLRVYLGPPVLSLSVGLFAFLLASALGSALSERRQATPGRSLRQAAGFILFWGLAFSLGWPALMQATLSWSVGWRCLLAVTVVFPFAVPMGLFFPLAVWLLGRLDRRLVPWAWAASGAGSVAGLLGCRVLAMVVGFQACTLLGIGLYLVAAVTLPDKRKVPAR
jgi:hypothetical protein